MIEIGVSECKETIVLGDVNCDYMKNSAHPEIKNIFTRNGLKQIIKRPTRITRDTHSLIDIIATSHENNINNYIVFPNSISDHDLTGASIKKTVKNLNQEQFIHEISQGMIIRCTRKI